MTFSFSLINLFFFPSVEDILLAVDRNHPGKRVRILCYGTYGRRFALCIYYLSYGYVHLLVGVSHRTSLFVSLFYCDMSRVIPTLYFRLRHKSQLSQYSLFFFRIFDCTYTDRAPVTHFTPFSRRAASPSWPLRPALLTRTRPRAAQGA